MIRPSSSTTRPLIWPNASAPSPSSAPIRNSSESTQVGSIPPAGGVFTTRTAPDANVSVEISHPAAQPPSPHAATRPLITTTSHPDDAWRKRTTLLSNRVGNDRRAATVVPPIPTQQPSPTGRRALCCCRAVVPFCRSAVRFIRRARITVGSRLAGAPVARSAPAGRLRADRRVGRSPAPARGHLRETRIHRRMAGRPSHGPGCPARAGPGQIGA